ncbi:MAG: formate dehydrogenase accessory sulfurtransferase FdhD, partial [Myxococcota bacterium]
MGGIQQVRLSRIVDRLHFEADDAVVVEEPLSIRIARTTEGLRDEATLAVTMRTPGQDEELALGFAFNEGVIQRRADVHSVRRAGPRIPQTGSHNEIVLELAAEVAVNWTELHRHSEVSSSCGVCGKTLIDARRHRFHPAQTSGLFSRESILAWSETAFATQTLFHATGGIHAVALFHANGALQGVREDVGRHNAL